MQDRIASQVTHRTWKKPARLALVVPVLVALALNAGSSSRSDRAAAASAPADTTTITIQSGETTLAFDPDRITVKQGAIVRIRYVNESTFAHNLVIVKQDADIDVIGPAAHEAPDNSFVPPKHKNRMIAFSPLASPGKTVELVFVAPAAGEYPYVCFVDGHYNVMIGKLVVRS